MIRFKLKRKRKKNEFSTIYREDEYSFDVEPYQEGGFTSILVNDLHLELDSSGVILYLWGLCPIISYEEIDNYPKGYENYSLQALVDKPLIPGVSFSVCDSGRWPLFFNKTKRWLCIGDPSVRQKVVVEFVSNCVAALEEEKLTAIWIYMG